MASSAAKSRTEITAAGEKSDSQGLSGQKRLMHSGERVALDLGPEEWQIFSTFITYYFQLLPKQFVFI